MPKQHISKVQLVVKEQDGIVELCLTRDGRKEVWQVISILDTVIPLRVLRMPDMTKMDIVTDPQMIGIHLIRNVFNQYVRIFSTYYWWIRDHWFREYNGRLRCCCGWYDNENNLANSVPLYSRRIANRCDYRGLVTRDENLDECRDANEEHGLGFDDIGCDEQYESSQLGQPVPDNDDTCWEIGRFGADGEIVMVEDDDGDEKSAANMLSAVVIIVNVLFVYFI